jgi:hypothetical protein
MAAIDSLPGDQRAVLQLVLGRGRSYDEIAGLLSINPEGVRERARAATDALGPQTRVPDTNRQMICDYLLGQLPAHDIPAVRELLAHSAPERGWARVLSQELAPLSAGPLPEIPVSTGPSAAPSPAAPPIMPAPGPVSSPTPPLTPIAPPVTPTLAAAPDSAPVVSGAAVDGEPAGSTPRRRGRRRDRAAKRPKAATPAKAAKPTRAQRRAAAAAGETEKVRSSRRGGMVVIAIAVIVIAAVVVLVAKHHHSHTVTASAHVTQTNPASATQTSSSTSSTGAAANPAGAKVVTQVNLSPTTAGSKAAAIADVLQEGSEREVAIVGQNVPANTAHNSYEVWLYNSPSNAVSLGFVDPGVTANGKLSTAGPLPADASSYRKLIITTETVAKPKQPGLIVLSGTISGL